jgi:hypothetical protein
MADLGLRPLTLGEILDRTFSLYRKNFVLFLGITAIPHLLILAASLAQTFFIETPTMPAPRFPRTHFQATGTSTILAIIGGAVLGLVCYVVAYLFSQGATVFAVSELYLGRPTTIGASFGKMRGRVLNLLGVLLLNGLAILAGFFCLIIPGFYVLCRLLTCIPAAVLEDLGPVDSLERSYSLTKDFAGRAFLIYVLYIALTYAATLLFAAPFSFTAILLGMKNADTMRTWMALANVGTFVAGVLVQPVFTIATALFYYDLRIRKEGFDLQFMLNPNDPLAAQAPSIVPRSLF